MSLDDVNYLLVLSQFTLTVPEATPTSQRQSVDVIVSSLRKRLPNEVRNKSELITDERIGVYQCKMSNAHEIVNLKTLQPKLVQTVRNSRKTYS